VVDELNNGRTVVLVDVREIASVETERSSKNWRRPPE
jgi:hypothetical protein